MFGVFGGILSLGARQPVRDFAGEFRFNLDHAGVAHGLVLGGVGADFRAVDRDVIKPDEACFAAERQNLHEQA
jgi:hypothetical protein